MSKEKLNRKEDSEIIESRRNFLTVGGMTMVGTALVSAGVIPGLIPKVRAEEVMGMADQSGITTENGGSKPVYLPEQNVKDPATLSLAENLFWVDIMMEHAMFFVMLMPGDELKSQRTEAQNFQQKFAKQLQVIRQTTWNKDNYKSLNNSTTALVRPFYDYKLRMLELQSSGKMRSLVWPLFFTHTAREALRFINRLQKLSRGQVELARNEVVDFWTSTMGEHSLFIAHLLDPQETALIRKANATANTFFELKKSPAAKGNLLNAGEEIIDFKTAAEKGIETGKIKSIIHPALADHTRREAVKYVDELKRT